MSWLAALDALAGLNVPGVRTHYHLSELPGVLPAADLPALLPVFPDAAGDDEGLAALTCDGGAWKAVLNVEHVLLWGPLAAGDAGREALPGLLTLVDATLAALATDGTLGGALHEPLAVTGVLVGPVVWGGVRYHAARFRHRWVRIVG